MRITKCGVRRQFLLGWVGASLVVLLIGCGTDDNRGLTREEWATISAIETRVAMLSTAVPAGTPSTPAMPFGQAWQVAIRGVTRASNFSASADNGSEPSVMAFGVFLAVQLDVTNLALEPVETFPWWRLRLQDERGRVFTPQEEPTNAYVASQPSIREPEEYQPGIIYKRALVFDVPPEAGGFMLVATDGSVEVPLPLRERSATPLP